MDGDTVTSSLPTLQKILVLLSPEPSIPSPPPPPPPSILRYLIISPFKIGFSFRGKRCARCCEGAYTQYTGLGAAGTGGGAAMSSGGRASGCRKPKSGSAAVDAAVLVVVIVALGVLAYPFIRLLVLWLIGGVGFFLAVLGEEIRDAQVIYGLVGMSMCCTGLGCWLLLASSGRKCANPKCKGLKKAAQFDIQLETEEYVRKLSINSDTRQGSGMLRRGLFELPRDHHRELEEELRRMAPVNGRAVLLFRARCGCVVGRLDVPGLKKQRKVKMKK